MQNSNIDEEQYDNAVKKLSSAEKANVVLCFCEEGTINNFLKAIARQNLTGRFLIFGR